MKVPVLFLSYNRLEYTKKALEALLQCSDTKICVIDNGSTDGTDKYLESMRVYYDFAFLQPQNKGIAFAMNVFLTTFPADRFVAKVDNDTIVKPDFIPKMLAHMGNADIVQAKHPILKETHPGGFDEWVKGMPKKGDLRFNHFVGGSGIMFKREIVQRIPHTEWMLGGWRQWQRDNPGFVKAFATDVEIELLDTNENGADYSAYPEYYKETGRLQK